MSRQLDQTALGDQVQAAIRESHEADLTQWLQPEGIDARVDVVLDGGDDALVLGPVTLAIINWVETGPHRAACVAAQLSPMPVFATIDSPTVHCAACFTQVAANHARHRSGWCDVCKLDADLVSPVTATISLFNVLIFVCPECQVREQKANVQTRYNRIAGSPRVRPCEGEVRPSH